MKKLLLLTLFAAFSFFTVNAQCSSSKAKAMKTSYHENPDVVDIALKSQDHTTLVAAVKAAGLVETLKGDGPFTIFAPTNAACEALPEGTVSTLLKPENKSTLTKVLTYHVIPGKLDSKAVVNAIKQGGGTATVTAVSGGTLIAMIKEGEVYLKDEKGRMAKITAVDLEGSNGVIHVIDTVVLPE